MENDLEPVEANAEETYDDSAKILAALFDLRDDLQRQLDEIKAGLRRMSRRPGRYFPEGESWKR